MTAPQKSEAPLAGGAIAEEDAEEASILTMSDDARKRFATLQARFAMAGLSLSAVPHVGEVPGTFQAARWGLVKPLATLDDAERWLAATTAGDSTGAAGNGDRR